MEGLTGHIMFNDDGKRYNYTLHVVQMTIDSTITKVRFFLKIFKDNLIFKVSWSFFNDKNHGCYLISYFYIF